MAKDGFKKTIGTRAEVYHGTARRTSGGLTKGELMMNKHGRIVSKKKHATAKREMRLLKHGYATKKGKFGFVKTKSTKSAASRRSRGRSRSRSRRMRGGSPAEVGGSYTLDTTSSGGVSPSNASTAFSPSDI